MAHEMQSNRLGFPLSASVFTKASRNYDSVITEPRYRYETGLSRGRHIGIVAAIKKK
jgi:hypothetical protein